MKFEGGSEIVSTAGAGAAIEVSVRVHDHAGEGIFPIRRTTGEVMEHGFGTLLVHLPYDSQVRGSASRGSAVHITKSIHSGSSVGIAPVGCSGSEAVQYGQLAAWTQFVKDSFTGSSALRRDVVKVALRVHVKT